jgi:hypothetical protein
MEYLEWLNKKVVKDPHWKGNYMTLNKRNIHPSELYLEYCTEQKLNIHGVMQAEGSDVSEGAAVASEGQEEANTCAGPINCIKCGKSFKTVTGLWSHFDRCG